MFPFSLSHASNNDDDDASGNRLYKLMGTETDKRVNMGRKTGS